MAKRILVIDDEADIREVVYLSLYALKGWQTVPCSSKKALEQARLRPWDAIVMEVALYNVNGIELFITLQSDPITQSIPIILLTSKVLPYELQTYRQFNFAGIISKPFDPQYLGTRMSDILGWSKESCKNKLLREELVMATLE